MAKLLAAGRVDRGGLVISAALLDEFMERHGFSRPLHFTSARTGEGCDELKRAVVRAIDWKSVPQTTSPALYRRMQREILGLRDSGRVLIRFSELKQRIQMTLRDTNFTPEELDAAISLLSGPGMIQRLDFGGFILLRPEVLSSYAAAIVRTVRKHPQELGCIDEEKLLQGALDYQDLQRLPHEDERIVLHALLETLVGRGWCLRQSCDGSTQLTFPSYFGRERLKQPAQPNALVTYRFAGPTDEIYATLVVRLHHTLAFRTAALWKSAAEFQTQTGAALGFTLTSESEGSARLAIHVSPNVDVSARGLFLRYVHDHLSQHGRNVRRLRHYGCVNEGCEAWGETIATQDAIDRALAPGGRGVLFCVVCGNPIHLSDEIEGVVESPAVKEQVRQLEEESALVIDNESMELILVGQAFSVVGEAGQIFRGYTNSDHGIDGEIEFKTDAGQASGKRLYVQLKCGDSYLKRQNGGGAEVFEIKNPHWAVYWQQQAYPVMLVIRTSNGEIRWMDVTSYLKQESDNGRKAITQILFEGERFDVLSVRRWRDRTFGAHK
jgi:hypothetical protein